MLKRHNIYMQCRKRKGKRTVLSLSMRVIYKILKLTPETLSELLDLIDNGEPYLGFSANRDIKKNEELLINYDMYEK